MATLTDKTIELSRLTFHYREAGDPGAPPLILLHGLMYDARDWDEIAHFLAEYFHVFALTQRGHGESARAANYSFELMCDDLEQFANALALKRFTLDRTSATFKRPELTRPYGSRIRHVDDKTTSAISICRQ